MSSNFIMPKERKLVKIQLLSHTKTDLICHIIGTVFAMQYTFEKMSVLSKANPFCVLQWPSKFCWNHRRCIPYPLPKFLVISSPH